MPVLNAFRACLLNFGFVDISDNKLTAIPDDVALMEELEVFRAVHNAIRSLDEFPLLHQLVELDIRFDFEWCCCGLILVSSFMLMIAVVGDFRAGVVFVFLILVFWQLSCSVCHYRM